LRRIYLTVLTTLFWSTSVTAWALELDCVLEPKERLQISAAFPALVAEFYVDRGDFVEAGQPLVRLESSMEEAAYMAAKVRSSAMADIDEAQARLAFERRRSKRNDDLFSQGVLSDRERDESASTVEIVKAELEQARHQRRLAELDLMRAKAALELKTIRSPVAGVVVRRIVGPSEYADPPQLLELAQLDPLRVEAYAPIVYFDRIEIGSKVIISVELHENRKYEGTVTIVDRVADAASGTFGIRAAVPNPNRSLPGGMRCQLIFPKLQDSIAAEVVPDDERNDESK